jgi:hypothetical protein
MPGAVTHKKTEFALETVAVDILEFGPDLFHDSSPILMPSVPGSEDKVPGVKAIAVVFKQFEFDPAKRMIICGHSKPGGDVKEDFELSALRAQNVLYLLVGAKEPWIEISFKQHRIEDYQRIMKHFHVIRGWNCNPGDISNEWSDQTKSAAKEFFDKCREGCMPDLEIGLHGRVEEDDRKKWPPQAWEAVFNLYTEEIARALDPVNPPDLDQLRADRLKFVKEGKEFVACGESFPLTEPKKSNYTEVKDRRVEILFFNDGEGPGQRKGQPKFTCPAGGDQTHTAGECPIWYNKHFTATYIDPRFDLTAVAYHLKFVYHDRIRTKTEFEAVPEGLTIEAHYYETKDDPSTRKSLNTVTKFHDGVYTVKVPDDPDRDNIHFEFKTPDQWWIFTGDEDKTPVILKNTAVDVRNLTDLKRRFRYYDLPKEWSSENYWTRYDNKMSNGERFRKVMENVKSLKPYGSNLTAKGSPLVFSLDDIVLVDKNGKQNINDPTGNRAKDKDKADTAVDLAADSRVSLLHVHNDDLVLYKPEDENRPVFSDIPFKSNLITDVPAHARMVIFANDFYSIYDKRSGQNGEQFDRSKGHVKGCRAARLEDHDNHAAIGLVGSGGAAPYLYYAKGVGNFELHYVHNGCPIKDTDGLKTRSFLIVYWNGRFKDAFDAGSSDAHAVAAADIGNYEKQGMINAKKRWELKGYVLEPEKLGSGDKGKLQIKPVFFFEAKKPDHGGKHKCDVTITNDTTAGEMGVTSSEMYYKDYQVRDYLGVGKFWDMDGKSFETLVVSHELGHAMGLDDEYTYDDGDISAGFQNTDDGVFSQYYLGMPYNVDQGSMMVTNRAPRMRNLWMFVNRINEASDAAGAHNELNGLLGGAQYKLVYRFTRRGRKGKLNFFLSKTPKDYRDIYSPYKSERGVDTGTGEIDLALYRLGEDETAWNIKINGKRKKFAFDGLLVAFIKVGFDFQDYIDNSDPAHPVTYTWTAAAKRTWMQGVKTELLQNGRFYLQGVKENPEFRYVYLFFFPICLETTDPETHYDIEVTKNKTKKVAPRSAPLTTLELGNKASRRWVAKYILGNDLGGSTTVGSKKIKADKLTFIRDWLCKELYGSGCSKDEFVIKSV